MRKIVSVLLLCVAAGFALDGGIANAVREVEGLPAPTVRPATDMDAVESDLDRILSGEEALPVLSEQKVSSDVHGALHRFRVWLHKQRDALYTFLIASGVSILLGAALALFMRHLVARHEKERHRMRWLVVAALSGPVILMLASGAIFLFLLPILHSLPSIYPIEARLFFTWLTLLAAWAGFQVIAIFDLRLRSFAERPDSTLDSLMVDITRKVLKIVIAIVTILFIGQSIFQLNITTLLAGAGVAGLAVAFASRETLANFFGTMVIILDRPFRIGDRIKAGEVNGIVLSVGMRSTRILTGFESVVSIPNNTIAEEAIENISNRGVIRYLFTLGLVYGTTPEEMQLAMKLVHEVVDNFKGPDAPQRNPRVFFEEFAASSLNIRVIMWLKTTSFDVEEALRTEVNLEILRRFAENNLNMAFNTQTNCLTGSVQLLPPPAPAGKA